MFTETFDDVVLTQLQLRRLYNLEGLSWFDQSSDGSDIITILNQTIPYTQKYNQQYYKQWGVQWATKFPFVMAYSNVRYSTDTSSDEGAWIQSDQQHSVLSSNFNISNKSQVYNRTYNFNDYYQETELIGVVSKPIISQFTIDRRTANNTLRNISFKIICFSHEHFLHVRDYYCVPGTSVFFQYGHATKHTINTLFTPIVSKSEIYDKGSVNHNYLSYKNSKMDSIRRSRGGVQYCTGIVYNYEIQQINTKFIITVKLMTQGASQLLTLIRNASEVGQDKSSGMSNLLRDIASMDIFSNEVISFKSQKINSTYVTLNWFGNVVLQIIRARGNLYLVENSQGTSRIATSVRPGNPILKYDITTHLPSGLCSVDPNVFIYDPNIPNCPKNVNPFYIQKDDILNHIIQTQHNIYSNYLNIQKIFKKIQIQLSDDVNSASVDANADIWLTYYERLFRTLDSIEIPTINNEAISPKTTQTKLVFLGNIYINLDVITKYLDTHAQIKMTGFIDHILNTIDSAFSSKINLQYYSNDIGDTVQISQKSYVYKSNLGFYKLPNFGNQSIVRQLSIKAKVPESIRLITVGQYNQRTYSDEYEDGLIKIFESLFGNTKRLIDINLPSIANRLALREATSAYSQTIKSTQKPVQKSDTNKTDEQVLSYEQAIKHIWNDKGTNINSQYLKKTNVINAIAKRNSQISSAEMRAIKKQLNISLYDHSVYTINIQITLDFIAGLTAGQMFKLQFNPLGWQSCFTVLASDHSISDRGATTKIVGLLLSVEG